jgi:hypothetical protein
MSTFCVAAKTFSWNKTESPYDGFVVFGEDHVYFIVACSAVPANEFDSVAGAITTTVLGVRTPGNNDPLMLRLKPVDPTVLADPNWPVPKEFTLALQFHKEELDRIDFPWWTSLSITHKTCIYTVQAGFFSHGRIVAFLRDHRWPIAGGQYAVRRSSVPSAKTLQSPGSLSAPPSLPAEAQVKFKKPVNRQPNQPQFVIPSPSPEDSRDEILACAITLTERTWEEKQIARHLQECGISELLAKEVVDEAQAMKRRKHRKVGLLIFASGITLGVLAILCSIGPYCLGVYDHIELRLLIGGLIVGLLNVAYGLLKVAFAF